MIELYELALIQEKLDQTIIENHYLQGEDLYNSKKLALLVELGELANEIRFFKFWSIDKKPRTETICSFCKGGKYVTDDLMCHMCLGTGIDESKNPMLEEYVDGIHFILSLGLDRYTKTELKDILQQSEPLHYTNLEDQFISLFYEISSNMYSRWELIIRYYLGLGKLLDFTINDIVQAYYAKNKINFKRQDQQY